MGGDACTLAGRKGRGRRGNMGRGEMLRVSGIRGRGAEVGVTGARGRQRVLEGCRSEQGPAGRWIARLGDPLCPGVREGRWKREQKVWR